MKRFCIFTLWLAILFAAGIEGMSAQPGYYHDDEYRHLYNHEHRVVVRRAVEVRYDYQDLWNGDYGRDINGTIYIYRNGDRITYGDRVWLMFNGSYIIKRGDTEYLLDSDGDRTGVHGDEINLFWNGIAHVRRGDYYYLYTRDGSRMGYVYSDEDFELNWDGTYIYHSGGYWRIADREGSYITNSYSEEPPKLLDSGNYRIWRSGRSFIIDSDGDRVY